MAATTLRLLHLQHVSPATLPSNVFPHPMEIHMKEGTTAKAFHTSAPVPLFWQNRVEEGLFRNEELGIIERVPYGEPVDWCHRMVITAKHDNIPCLRLDLLHRGIGYQYIYTCEQILKILFMLLFYGITCYKRIVK